MPDPANPLPEGHRPEGHGDAELIQSLEPDQLIANASRPFPLMKLSGAANAGLWLLRGFGLLIAGVVVYTFVFAMRHGG